MRLPAVNLIGALVSVVLACALFGEQIEERLFPARDAGENSNIVRTANSVTWRQTWCKLRPLELIAATYTFSYPKQKVSIPINVTNLTQNKSVGLVTYPAGCFAVDYSAMLPRDAVDGGTIRALFWYNPGHPFWDVSVDLTILTVPALPSTLQDTEPHP